MCDHRVTVELIMIYVIYISFSRPVLFFFLSSSKIVYKYIYRLRGFYRDAYKGFTGVLRLFLQSLYPIFMRELFYDLAVDRTIGNYYIREKYNAYNKTVDKKKTLVAHLQLVH